jgi:hypothetical protein
VESETNSTDGASDLDINLGNDPQNQILWQHRRPKHPTQHKRELHESVWDTIDITAFGRYFKHIPLAHRLAHLKFVHNQRPLGDWKFLCSSIKDTNLKIRPCCLTTNQDPHHFQHCNKNSEQTLAVATFLKSTLKDPHPSCLAFTICMELYLQQPDQPLHPLLPYFPSHMQQTLDDALSEQTRIGWIPALQRFFSKQWSVSPQCPY